MIKGRKEKTTQRRILNSVASFMFIGSIIVLLVAGFNGYMTTLLATGALGLAAPSVMSGDSLFEIIVDFFEALLEGIADIVAGIVDAISSIFG